MGLFEIWVLSALVLALVCLAAYGMILVRHDEQITDIEEQLENREIQERLDEWVDRQE